MIYTIYVIGVNHVNGVKYIFLCFCLTLSVKIAKTAESLVPIYRVQDDWAVLKVQ